ncbi:MAG: hypothetical protein ABI347_03520 [Nitrososphaera sp.]
MHAQVEKEVFIKHLIPQVILKRGCVLLAALKYDIKVGLALPVGGKRCSPK